jgi:hypothetical protein
MIYLMYFNKETTIIRRVNLHIFQTAFQKKKLWSFILEYLMIIHLWGLSPILIQLMWEYRYKDIQGCSKKWQGSLACSSRLTEMGMNHDMKLSSLLINIFIFRNAELSDKQLTKCT